MVEWIHTPGFLDYTRGVVEMEARVAGIRAGTAREAVWLVEHAPLYTAGTSAKGHDLLEARFPVHATGRGGQYTYHGPGQRVAYVMLDLQARAKGKQADIRHYVWQLEEWLIRALAMVGVTGERRAGRVGIWVVHGLREDKIAALGVRVRHGVTYHGVAVNVSPDLAHFNGIVPCGIGGFGVTSLAAMGHGISMADMDNALRSAWPGIFGA